MKQKKPDAFDAHQLIRLLNQHTRVAVGDTTYGARVMREIIWEKYGTGRNCTATSEAY